MKKFKLTNWLFKVQLDPYHFCIESKRIANYKKHFYLCIFILVSLVSLVSAFLLSVLSSLKLAKLWIFAENGTEIESIKNLLDNYVYIVNALNSIVALMSTLIAFFSFKNGYLKNKNIYKKLCFEILQYDNKIGFYNNEEKQNKLILIDRVFAILNNNKN